MTEKHTLKELARIYRILEAGEKGYAVSAVNINNRGLKVLFKSFAQQRARFKSEILAELHSLGGEMKTRSSLLGVIHRGRINIFATLTIGKDERERVVLKEILIGERFALHAYKRALKKELHPESCILVARQLMEMQQVVEQVSLLHGREGKRLVIRLFDNVKDAENAVLEIKNAGLQPEMIDRLSLNDAIELYEGKSTTVIETVISGAVGGAFWGGLIGILASVGMLVAGFAPSVMATGHSIWAFLAIVGVFAGEFVGSVLGFAIGVGLAGEDAYQYELSIKRGKILLIAMVDALQAPEAGQIMALVNLRSRERIEEATA